MQTNKQTKPNLLKCLRLLLFITTLFILKSCSKDSLGSIDSKSTDGKISFDMLKKQIGQPNLNKTIAIGSKKSKTQNISFTIDTSTIKRLTRERIVYSMVVLPNFVEDTIRNYNLLFLKRKVN